MHITTHGAGSGATFETARGSRPGSPLADIAFNAMMIPILRHLQEALLHMDSLQTGLQLLGLPAPPVTWVDDVAIPIATQCCSQLEATLVQVATSSLLIFRQAGLTLNFSSRKAEAVISFRGTQAPGHRHSLFVERLGRLDLDTDGIFLACVGSYEHLGTTFTSDGLLKEEIAHRRARAIQAHRQVAKGVLRNRHIAVTARLKLFESLIMPILLHGAGNWGLLPTRSFNCLHACIMSWQRSIINDGFWTDDQHTDFSLQCLWKLPPLAVRLAKARLLYAFHWARDGPRLLVDYATANQAPHAWFQALRHALGWLATLDGYFCPRELQASAPEVILEWLTQHVNDGPRTVRRLYKKCLMQNHVLGDVIDLHAQLKQTLERHGLASYSRLTAACSALGVLMRLTSLRNCKHIFGLLIRSSQMSANLFLVTLVWHAACAFGQPRDCSSTFVFHVSK